MKTIINIFVSFVLIVLTVAISSAQSGQFISYQAVVRDASGALIKNRPVGVRISILQGSSSGNTVFQELHNPNPETNENGLLNIEIGSGITLTPSKLHEIDWSTGDYFIKSEIDPASGTNYSLISTAALNIVPYAFYAFNGGKGEKGDKGDQGEKGDRGEQGLKGDKGDRGDKGDIGDRGEKGDRGEQGIKGDKGDRGDKGDNGDRGEKGDRGDRGTQGEKGEKGDRGEKGEKGDRGEPGPPGSGSGNINGSGTSGNIPRWTSSSTLGDSKIKQQSNGSITINSDVNHDYTLQVDGEFTGIRNGIRAFSINGIALAGISEGEGYGIIGTSHVRDGVTGESVQGNGVLGFSDYGNGVIGTSINGYGLSGNSINNHGIEGHSGLGTAGHFVSTGGNGLFARANGSGYGAQIESAEGTALQVTSESFYGKGIQVSAPDLALEVSGNVLFGGSLAMGIYPPSYRIHLNYNSAAKTTSNTWTVASDERLKKDVRDYKGGLSDLMKIHPVWFTYNGKAGMPDETGVGVLAQELQEVAPYMVSSWKYKPETVLAKPETSTSSLPEEEYLAVDNGAMTYMLINAAKELKTENDQLKSVLSELHRKYESQQAMIDNLNADMKAKLDTYQNMLDTFQKQQATIDQLTEKLMKNLNENK